MVLKVRRLAVVGAFILVACATTVGPSATAPIPGDLGESFKPFVGGEWGLEVPSRWSDQHETGLPYDVHRFFGPFGEELLVLWGPVDPDLHATIDQGLGSVREPLNQVTISPQADTDGPAGFTKSEFTVVGTDPAKSESPVAQAVVVLRQPDRPFLALILEVPGEEPPITQMAELVAKLDYRG